jgi:hypothetical protein
MVLTHIDSLKGQFQVKDAHVTTDSYGTSVFISIENDVEEPPICTFQINYGKTLYNTDQEYLLERSAIYVRAYLGGDTADWEVLPEIQNYLIFNVPQESRSNAYASPSVMVS